MPRSLVPVCVIATVCVMAGPRAGLAQPHSLQEQIALGLLDASRIATVREVVVVPGVTTASTIGKSTLPLAWQPLTVQTVTSDFLQTYAINDLVEALQTVNNVNVCTQYGVYEYYTVRGFSESVQLVDGIRNEGNRVRTQLSNVERVEVLKGPSSVLYGSEAMAAR